MRDSMFNKRTMCVSSLAVNRVVVSDYNVV